MLRKNAINLSNPAADIWVKELENKDLILSYSFNNVDFYFNEKLYDEPYVIKHTNTCGWTVLGS